jgi:hypothetical protein
VYVQAGSPVPAEACADRARRVVSDIGGLGVPTPISLSRRGHQIRAGWGYARPARGGARWLAPGPHYQAADMPLGDAAPRRERKGCCRATRKGETIRWAQPEGS